MATPSTRVLTLFDPDDKHEWCETRFNEQIFIRINNPQLCHDHIRIHVTHPKLDVHLFFSDAQIKLITNWSPEHSDTLKYIYCPDQKSINSIRKTYGRCFAHKLFTADDLEFEMNHVQIALLHSLAKQAPEESDERNRLVSIAMQELDGLRHKLNQMRTDQTGEPPVE